MPKTTMVLPHFWTCFWKCHGIFCSNLDWHGFLGMYCGNPIVFIFTMVIYMNIKSIVVYTWSDTIALPSSFWEHVLWKYLAFGQVPTNTMPFFEVLYGSLYHYFFHVAQVFRHVTWMYHCILRIDMILIALP